MIKLFSLKQQKKDEVPGRASSQKKASAAQLRITKGTN
jgi:ubiquitin-conjugating enzyme E2 M